MRVAVMGCVVNGPGESKHANIGISLPGSGEAPVAPVFVDGEKTVTLKGERIAEEFQSLVNRYVENRYGTGQRIGERTTEVRARRLSERVRNFENQLSMSQTIQAVRGMNDILPDQTPLWEFFEEIVREWLAQYGYRNIRMPILEKTRFVRARDRRGHRYRRKGDVQFCRSPERRKSDAAPGRYGFLRAGGDAA